MLGKQNAEQTFKLLISTYATDRRTMKNYAISIANSTCGNEAGQQSMIMLSAIIGLNSIFYKFFFHNTTLKHSSGS